MSAPSKDPVSVLAADSTYDDQGLLFALVLCGCILLVYVPLVMYTMGTSTLWLKRFYRPNHTLEPPPRSATPPPPPTAGTPLQPPVRRERSAGSGAGGGGEEESDVPRDSSGNDCHTSPAPSPAPPRAVAGGTPTPTAAPPSGRRKRLGLSLPYRPTLFQLPSWRDWVSVEEHVPHLESALSYRHVANAGPARYAGSRVYVPLSPSASRVGRLDRGGGEPVADATATHVRCAPSPGTPLSPFRQDVGGTRQQRSYGAVSPTDHHSSHGSRSHHDEDVEVAMTAAVDGEELPKTPLDPQVALYIFTLKYFFSLMFLGECFTIWISFFANQDDYNEYSMVQRDTRRCHREDANETGCLLKRPHCKYLGEDLGCSPVALRGLYDLTIQNIRPGSWRWWPVVLLNCGFCLVVVALTLFYVSRVSDYVTRVMAQQMKHALGYRVACVRGVSTDETRSVSAFSASFLEERAYFLPTKPLPPTRREGGANRGDDSSGGGGGGGGHDESVQGAAARAARDHLDEFDYYEQLDCNGLDCLFGVAGCHYYTTHRSDAVFTRPGRVRHVLFTRKPPPGMYKAIARAESAMAEMQDVIAHEKAIKRKLRRRQLRAHPGLVRPIRSPSPAVHAHDDAGTVASPPTAPQAPPPAEAEGGTGGALAVGLTRSQPSRGPRRKSYPPRAHHHVQNQSMLYSLAALRPPTSSEDEWEGEERAEPRATRGAGGGGPRAGSSARGGEAGRGAGGGEWEGVRGLSPTGLPVRGSDAGGQGPVRATGAGEPRRREYTSDSILSPTESVDDLVLYTHTSLLACWREVPALPFYEERLRRAARELNRLLERVPQQPADSATFVIFADSRSAFEFINLFNARFGGCMSNTFANVAGPPGEIISNNMLADRLVLGIRFVCVFALFVVLVFSYSIPIGMLGSLENLSYMPGVTAGFSEYYVENVPAWLRKIINAYLPVIALSLFYVVLPFLMRFMVILMGAFNKSECDAGQLYLQYVFMVLTAVIFQAALQGGFAQLTFLATTSEGRYIAEFFVSCVTPSQASYFYAKVLTSLSLSVWNDLVDPIGVIKAFLFRAHAHVQRNYDALFIPCELEYPRRYSMDLMLLAMGLLFHMTMPLLGFFVAIYFLMRYITQRAKLYDRYRPANSPAHDCTDFTVCAQVLRATMWLYCLAELCGVLLLSLRGHSGGVMVCSMTLATAVALLIHVHMATRKWVASLGRVRQLAREERVENTRRARHATAATAEQATPTSPAGADAEGSVTGVDSTASATGEFANMDAYENVRFSLFDDTHSNPFIGHLLPRIPDAGSRYQPKHQRLAPLDVDAEVGAMVRSTFIVERYWDRGVTWFEADATEATPAAPRDEREMHGWRVDSGASQRAHTPTPQGDSRAGKSEVTDVVVEATVQGRPPAARGAGAEGLAGQWAMPNDSMLAPLRRQVRAQAEELELCATSPLRRRSSGAVERSTVVAAAAAAGRADEAAEGDGGARGATEATVTERESVGEDSAAGGRPSQTPEASPSQERDE